MKDIVNVTVESVVYVDSGTYNYTLAGTNNNANGGYSNRTFTVIAYISNILVNVDDISTYPIILFDINNANCAFQFYMNINVSFEYVKFYLGSNSNTGRRIMMSFIYLLLLIFSIYLFVD
jgi:hypothetical protein